MQFGVLCHKFITSFSEEVPYESLNGVSSCQSAKPQLQISHTYGFSPVCVRMRTNSVS